MEEGAGPEGNYRCSSPRLGDAAKKTKGLTQCLSVTRIRFLRDKGFHDFRAAVAMTASKVGTNH